MKQTLRQISSLLLAILVMFSTMSFTVVKHYCGEYLVDKAIFSEVQTCGMELNSEFAEDHCCSNETIAVEGQDELKMNFDSLDLAQQVFLSTFTYSYLYVFEDFSNQPVPFIHYSPPLLVRDIQLLDQVFLI